MTVDKVGVIGGGTMGAGIAEVCIKAGTDVTILEVKDEFAQAARARVEKSLTKAAERGKIDKADADAALARLRISLQMDDLADADLVVEAAPENEQMKLDLFARLDAITKPSAILASNTSSIPLARLATATERPGQVVGVHFFNPAPVMKLVEIVEAITTSEETVATVTEYVKTVLGKNAVQCGDRAGFIVNALLLPYLASAIRMVESGYASAEDVDAAMVDGCGHPMGPLTLADTIGIDVCLAIADSLHREFGEPHLSPPPLLRRMVDAGRLGKKSGRGFYDYSR